MNKQIIENCKDNLNQKLIECYEMGVFIINYKTNQRQKSSLWYNKKTDADTHYEKLRKDKNVVEVSKDYRYF